MSKRILITGGSGFVGQALVLEMLKRGYHLRLPLRENASCPELPEGCERITITDLQAADWAGMMHGVDAVVHLAAIAHIGPSIADEFYDRINHRVSVALGEAAAAHGVDRFIFMSSIRAMTGATSAEPLHIGLPPHPTDAYGRSKLKAEQGLATIKGLNVTSLRPVVIYGEGVKGNVATLLRVAKTGLPLPIGGLTARRSYLALENLADVVIDAIERPQPVIGPVIVADPEPMTLVQLLDHLLQREAQASGRAVKHPSIITIPQSILEWIIKPLKPDLWDKLAGEQVVATMGRIKKI
jgi:nucleoside-diphosphate-sugar epimerase